MILRKYVISTYSVEGSLAKGNMISTGFTEEEAIRKIAIKFTGNDASNDDGRVYGNWKYPLTFKAEEIE